MDALDRFIGHNLHWQSRAAFLAKDPQLSNLNDQLVQAAYPFDDAFPLDTPGIFTLTGGRQLGKSTSLKRQMLKALKRGVPAAAIFYLPCDTITDRSALYETLAVFLHREVPQSKSMQLRYLFIDEATYVSEWDLAIKALADEGLLRGVVCCISGSDRILIEDAIKRLAGRRGKAEVVDFSIYPLSFSEVAALVGAKSSTPSDTLFSHYLQHGGYITALNDWMQKQSVSQATFRTYQDWVVGDFIRLGKSKKTLEQVLRAVLVTYGSQVSYQTLADHTDGLVKDTVADYCDILERLDVLSVQYAFDQESLGPAPKKNKKIHFCDPFILRALWAMLQSSFPTIEIPEEAHVVESICYRYFQRAYPTYYIKAEGEVDIVYVKGRSFFPVEVKWRNQVRKQDLKQLMKYKTALILSKISGEQEVSGIKSLGLVETLRTGRL